MFAVLFASLSISLLSYVILKTRQMRYYVMVLNLIITSHSLIYSSGTSSDEDCETVVKMANDCWVVGKKAEDREIYVVVNQKNANLIEINGKTFKLWISNSYLFYFYRGGEKVVFHALLQHILLRLMLTFILFTFC